MALDLLEHRAHAPASSMRNDYDQSLSLVANSESHPIDLTSTYIDLTQNDRSPSPIASAQTSIEIDLETRNPSEWVPEPQRIPCGKAYNDVERRLEEAVCRPRITRHVSVEHPNKSYMKAGVCVELRSGMFLQITHTIARDSGLLLRGRWLFRSILAKEVLGFLPQTEGELVWLKAKRQFTTLAQVRAIRNIRFTNRRPRNWVNHEDLVCRLSLRIYEHSSSATIGERACVEYLTSDEADPRYSLSANRLRDEWRGKKHNIPFGTHELPAGHKAVKFGLEGKDKPQVIDLEAEIIDLDDDIEIIDLEELNPVIDLCEPRYRTYTFGDAFCGAGGVSCGARLAGLKVQWGFDHDKHAIETYRLNFGQDAEFIYEAPFDEFMKNNADDIRVDICHASPPCQPFSPAHTIDSQTRDERNSACLFAPMNILMHVKPRILTMEETAGLLERHGPMFNRVAQDMIECGYSVRWGLVRCFDHGVPQERKRLIIVAAGPGDTVPDFLPVTHGHGPGLQRPVNIADAIDNIPGNALNHTWQDLLQKQFAKGPKAPYDKHCFAKTLTCSQDGNSYHPSGKRAFTVRESACLQTFPLDFRFSQSYARKQIGNAVPPVLAKALLQHIARSLQATDEAEMQQAERDEEMEWDLAGAM